MNCHRSSGAIIPPSAMAYKASKSFFDSPFACDVMRYPDAVFKEVAFPYDMRLLEFDS